MPRPFGHVRDAAPRHRLGRAAEDLAAVEDHVPGRLHGAGDRAQRRRLAGAVRAEDRDEVAVVDAQRDAVQRADLAVARVDVAQLKQRQGAPEPVDLRVGQAGGAQVRRDVAVPLLDFPSDALHRGRRGRRASSPRRRRSVSSGAERSSARLGVQVRLRDGVVRADLGVSKRRRAAAAAPTTRPVRSLPPTQWTTTGPSASAIAANARPKCSR